MVNFDDNKWGREKGEKFCVYFLEIVEEDDSEKLFVNVVDVVNVVIYLWWFFLVIGNFGLGKIFLVYAIV